MKHTFLILTFMTVSVPASGQTNGTQFKGHRLGETFSEWLTISRLDPVTACQKKPDQLAIQQLDDLIDSPLKGSGSFEKLERKHDRQDLCQNLATISRTQAGQFLAHRATWTIYNGKVAEVDMVFYRFQTTPE